MALLKTLSAEVTQIKESIRQPSPTPGQSSFPPAVHEHAAAPQLQQPLPNLWPPPLLFLTVFPSEKMAVTKIMLSTVPIVTDAAVGSLAGCRVREIRQAGHLNERGLPPRDWE